MESNLVGSLTDFFHYSKGQGHGRKSYRNDVTIKYSRACILCVCVCVGGGGGRGTLLPTKLRQ